MGSIIKNKIRKYELYLMLIPGVIFMLIFNYLPMYGLSIAFKRYTVIDTFRTAPWVMFDNFKIIMSDRMFWTSVKNTLAISLLKMGIGFIVPIILAIMIFEVVNTRFKKFVQTVSYLPHFLSWIILGGMLINWLSTTGLMNQLLNMVGISASRSNHLLDSNKYWMIAVLSDIWKGAGWGTILYLAAMSKIDPNYYEAAELDGASRLAQIRHITIPLIRNIIILNFILTVSGLLGSNLDQTMVLMNSQNRSKAEVINSYVYKMGMTQGDFSYATAVGLGISLVSIVLLFVSNRVTSKLNDDESVL